jgi:hypothetical protein
MDAIVQRVGIEKGEKIVEQVPPASFRKLLRGNSPGLPENQERHAAAGQIPASSKKYSRAILFRPGQA